MLNPLTHLIAPRAGRRRTDTGPRTRRGRRSGGAIAACCAAIAAEIAPPDLEQPRSRRAPVGVALGGGEQARDERGAHGLHVLADRVVEHP